MKKRIEKYIPKAMQLIKETGIANDNDIVKNEFNGYFSSFGAAIIQNGLKPALAFFSKTTGEAKERSKILLAIYRLIIRDEDNIEPKTLLKHVIDLEGNEAQIITEIIDASIALKLAVRTYKLEK